MNGRDTVTGRLLSNVAKLNDEQVSQTIDLLITQAVKQKASDIHIEPHDQLVWIRFRINGVLKVMNKLPIAALKPIAGRLKSAAKIDPTEDRLPQEGEYYMHINNKGFKVQIVSMPVLGGEKLTLRIWAEQNHQNDLQSLGFWGQNLATLQSILARPHGLVLVGGPRHGGVTTTLSSLIHDLNSSLFSVSTLQSKINSRLTGANQTLLKRNFTPLESLQSALKQNSDVIMIDNLSGSKVCELAVDSATSGHLIIAGLRTEGAADNLIRLLHAGVEGFLLAAGLKASVGQRLVRKLCPDCRESYEPNEEEMKQISLSFGLTTQGGYNHLHRLEMLALESFKDPEQLGCSATKINKLWRPSQSGCQSCSHTGYQGQIAIVELLQNNDSLHKLVLAKTMPTVKEVQRISIQAGYIPLKIDGLIKALRGQTTISEILRWGII